MSGLYTYGIVAIDAHEEVMSREGVEKLGTKLPYDVALDSRVFPRGQVAGPDRRVVLLVAVSAENRTPLGCRC